MLEHDEFENIVVKPLKMQADSIGDDIENYRICGICMNYIPREHHSEHMASHGYKVVNIYPDCENK